MFMEYIVELSDYWAQIKNNLKDVFIGGCLATDIDQTNNIAYLYGGLSLDKPNNKLYKFEPLAKLGLLKKKYD